MSDAPGDERALSFGSVAAAYERHRPGYPDDVVSEVVAYAGRPVRTALEIGAGTGKATRVFARHGITVTATDPDPEMLTELRRHVPPTVVTVTAGLEGLPLTADFDLVFAAASLHWTDPAHRWPRVAGMLAPGGVFASFGGQVHLADDEQARAFGAVLAAYDVDDDVPSPDGTAADGPLQWPGTELRGSDLFTDVRQTTIPRRLTMSSDDYVGHLSTISAYLVLPEAVRRTVLGRIRGVLGDDVVLSADITLHLARRTA
ncbi:class I SAM-dependent methyltransferase [Nocardioides cynanchi]|uniref:class I SAM-dependent methyltransferase n=1 Tax=Nocardioides cynanchi TaxID=2558918 RepID=UPI001245CC74|nr:class I SAM-dependent methyltransferase [Nocardioides cynanchi]